MSKLTLDKLTLDPELTAIAQRYAEQAESDMLGGIKNVASGPVRMVQTSLGLLPETSLEKREGPDYREYYLNGVLVHRSAAVQLTPQQPLTATAKL